MLAVISFSSHVDDRLKNIVKPVKTGLFKGCFCEFVKKIEFVYFVLLLLFCFFFLSSDHLSKENESCIIVSSVSVTSE